MKSTESAIPTRVIEPKSGWRSIDFAELWEYRELVYFLVWRDVKVRYAQTVLGMGWNIVKPVMSMIVFTVIFGRLIGVSSDGAPYAIFVYAGLLPWNYYAGALGGASGGVNTHAALLTKIYIPRLLMPIQPVIGRLFDFGLAFIMFGVLLIWFRQVPTIWIITLPYHVLVMMLAATGLGMWVSALAIQYRDLKNILGYSTSFLMYASPVVYPASLVPEKYRLLYALNPMVGVIESFRSSFLGTNPMPWDLVGVGSVVAVTLAVSGAFYFKRMERNFADVV